MHLRWMVMHVWKPGRIAASNASHRPIAATILVKVIKTVHRAMMASFAWTACVATLQTVGDVRPAKIPERQ